MFDSFLFTSCKSVWWYYSGIISSRRTEKLVQLECPSYMSEDYKIGCFHAKEIEKGVDTMYRAFCLRLKDILLQACDIKNRKS